MKNEEKDETDSLIDYLNRLPKRFPLDVFLPDAGFYEALDENRHDDSEELSDEGPPYCNKPGSSSVSNPKKKYYSTCSRYLSSLIFHISRDARNSRSTKKAIAGSSKDC